MRVLPAGPAWAAMCLVLASSLPASGASAQGGGFTYAGRTVQVVIGVSPGGGYDAWGRIVARHIGRHLPGQPTVVAQNMPGAGSIVAANHIYNNAPKDGTVLGIINRDAPLAPLTGSANARFDATRFTWIGTPTVETNVCFVSPRASVRRIEDLREREVILGAVGPGSGSYNYPKALAGLLDLRIRLITGFPGSTEVFLAIERGEVDGMCESLDSVRSRRPGAFEEKRLHLLFQGGTEPNPELKGVPFIMDHARNNEERQALTLLYAGQGLGRPFVAPPDLPAGRGDVMRAAFQATLNDPAFRAEAKKQRLDLDPRTGLELEKLVKELYASPKELVKRIGELVR